MPTANPLVSVIIPCRNGAEWLGEAIDSCLGQSWRNLQIIVVNNNSTDRSLDVARSYEPRGIIVLECGRKGASAARNVGLSCAKGELIQFLDADDVLHPDKIRLQVERLASAPSDVVASAAWARFRTDPREAVFTPDPVWRDFAAEEFLTASWLGGGMMPNFAWLTPRALIERTGPWNERLSLNDDGEFFTRILLAASGVVFCDSARGYYRSTGRDTLSQRQDRDALASALAAIDLCCDKLLRRSASPVAARACATQYQRFVYAAYPQVPDLTANAERRVRELGGSELRPGGGHVFQTLSRIFGWKFAKRCQWIWWRLRESIGSRPR
jgi:hypothetical protein